ncbi:hypothetical protein TRFO_40978 [Tritrichomonas foetus]|uniref:Myb-like DNA-binding domain containing protein n=1 Tax=Tritrichomonas foetus TaxID=1144522 RepID=A0A1J4J3H2_9EUKA|nr:hypothetical protein TRFO_40978 [Tritrichomonas foetus]|eukprot:OHS92703.1 hypothetical protein TRFO_40978 [Tritrichomonas foetus]
MERTDHSSSSKQSVPSRQHDPKHIALSGPSHPSPNPKSQIISFPNSNCSIGQNIGQLSGQSTTPFPHSNHPQTSKEPGSSIGQNFCSSYNHALPIAESGFIHDFLNLNSHIGQKMTDLGQNIIDTGQLSSNSYQKMSNSIQNQIGNCMDTGQIISQKNFENTDHAEGNSHHFKNKFFRNPFTQEEDAKLVELVSSHLYPNWITISKFLPGRTARQCRERWTEYLDPTIKFEPWSDEEDQLLVDLVQKNGHRWTLIARSFNGRTDNDVKNRWYTHLKSAIQYDGDGKMFLQRDEKGEIASNKKKRKRRIVCANQNAFLALEQKQKQIITSMNPQNQQTISPNLPTNIGVPVLTMGNINVQQQQQPFNCLSNHRFNCNIQNNNHNFSINSKSSMNNSINKNIIESNNLSQVSINRTQTCLNSHLNFHSQSPTIIMNGAAILGKDNKSPLASQMVISPVSVIAPIKSSQSIQTHLQSNQKSNAPSHNNMNFIPSQKGPMLNISNFIPSHILDDEKSFFYSVA